jgi:acyl-coenzyme A thioesterase PaaI-like protein
MKGESARSYLIRFAFNLFPCYRRTGARIIYISPDVREVRIKLPLNWKTRGYNGTLFGGSMYACVDPVYMTMISWNLGRDYIAWDTAATVDFRKAGRSTLYSTFKLEPGMLESIREDVQTHARAERTFDVVLADDQGVAHAAFTKTIVVKKRRPREQAKRG